SSNPGVSGNCTWGAAWKWHEATGSYPALYTNYPYPAYDWDTSARAVGLRVYTATPVARSIVVFEPGIHRAGSLGHVAWVTSVTKESGNVYIDVQEMNMDVSG